MRGPSDNEGTVQVSCMHTLHGQASQAQLPGERFAGCLCRCECRDSPLPARSAHARFSNNLQLMPWTFSGQPAADISCIMHSQGIC